MADRKLENR